METLQIILTFSLIILCLTFVAVLIYLLFILKDVKDTTNEAKEIIKTGRKVMSSVVAPVTAIMGVMEGVSKGLKAVSSIGDIFDKDEEDNYEEY